MMSGNIDSLEAHEEAERLVRKYYREIVHLTSIAVKNKGECCSSDLVPLFSNKQPEIEVHIKVVV